MMLKNALILLISIVYLSKTSAQSISLLTNVRISFNRTQTATTDQTTFFVNTPLSGGVSISNAWVGIGLNNGMQMSGGHVFICRNSATSKWVQHYYTSGYSLALKNSATPALGISNSAVNTVQSNLTCLFTVDNKNSCFSQVDYTQAYVIVAFGTGIPFSFFEYFLVEFQKVF